MFVKLVFILSSIAAVGLGGIYFYTRHETRVTIVQETEPVREKPTLKWGSAAEQNEQVRKAFSK